MSRSTRWGCCRSCCSWSQSSCHLPLVLCLPQTKDKGQGTKDKSGGAADVAPEQPTIGVHEEQRAVGADHQRRLERGGQQREIHGGRYSRRVEAEAAAVEYNQRVNIRLDG